MREWQTKSKVSEGISLKVREGAFLRGIEDRRKPCCKNHIKRKVFVKFHLTVLSE